MSKRSILIELTPLLDVIMVIMFFILLQSGTRVDMLHAETQDAFASDLAAAQADFDASLMEAAQNYAAAIAEFRDNHSAEFAEMDSLRGQLDELQNLLMALDEDAGVITLRHYSTFGNLLTRHIMVESPGFSTRVDIVGDFRTNLAARDEAVRALSVAITEQLNAMNNDAAFIVFIFDGWLFLSYDRPILNLVMHNLRLHHRSVFSMEIDLR